MKMILAAPALAAALTVGLVACGDSSKTASSTSGAAAPNNDGKSGASNEAPGVAASSLTCDKFPISDLQAAAQQVVPSAKAQQDTGSIGLGNNCRFAIFTPGTDTTSGNAGEVGVILTINDSYDSSDGQTGPGAQQKAFDNLKDTKPYQGVGYRVTQSDVSGVGAEAYLIDTANASGGGPVIQYQDELHVLHSPRPYSFFISTDYEIPDSGQPLPDKSLDTAMRDDSKRAQLITAIAKALLARTNPGS